ncbi:ATP-binding protein [Myxosarcina sp. GI1]|uniref:ATP-binding protein n=1 Tax=Myxosarcina sp. GI1 TaxID=1541065 RepID=UPI0005650F38|nr:AAA family ATPase [Myxosarcina sp. GI1]
MNDSNWQQLRLHNLLAIESPLVDRQFLLLEIARFCPEEKIFFWNPGYKELQLVKVDFSSDRLDICATEYVIKPERDLIEFCCTVGANGIFVIEGSGEIDRALSFQLRNAYFKLQSESERDDSFQRKIILVDDRVDIPLEIHPLIPLLKRQVPNIDEIEELIKSYSYALIEPTIVRSCIGLTKGEIEILVKNRQNEESLSMLKNRLLQYKTNKLAGRGLRIVPEPDVIDVGGLDNLKRDLRKIEKLFSPEAFARGLSPPRGCCLWGLPGTGKSLIAKMMSKKIGATLISCDWNQLLDTDLTKSLANLQYVLDLVDSMGACVLFFDEFEKAFAGWNSGANGGILAKMAGKLLTWMQDHTSPSIMLATINHLDMLPPELIRRFEYIWFFPSKLHNGAMWEIFKLHLDKHFPNLHQQFNDAQWRTLFLEYRGCSPAEIAGAVKRAHDEIFFCDRHLQLKTKVLIEELLAERARFKPASSVKSISNALAKILMEADFARLVHGKDTSRFASPPRQLYEAEKLPTTHVTFDDYQSAYNRLVLLDENQEYTYPM